MCIPKVYSALRCFCCLRACAALTATEQARVEALAARQERYERAKAIADMQSAAAEALRRSTPPPEEMSSASPSPAAVTAAEVKPLMVPLPTPADTMAPSPPVASPEPFRPRVKKEPGVPESAEEGAQIGRQGPVDTRASFRAFCGEVLTVDGG